MPLSQVDKFERLYDDMYIGNGKGNEPMTTRVAILEEKHESILKRFDDITEVMDALKKGQDKLLYTVLGLLGAFVTEIVIKLVVK